MPKTHVSRSIEIQARPEDVFARVHDFLEWPSWSPWLRIEPECPIDVFEHRDGYRWDGDLIGRGEIRRVDASEPESMTCELRFEKPFRSSATASFHLQVVPNGTRLTWVMDGSLPLILFWMRPMVESMIGMDYDRGLAMLKDLCETGRVPSTVTVHPDEMLPAAVYVGIRSGGPLEEVGKTMQRDFKRVLACLSSLGTEASGPPFVEYGTWDLRRGEFACTLGFPVAEVPDGLPEDLVTATRKELRACAVEHRGPYRHLGNAWAVGMAHGRAKRFLQDKRRPPVEVYVSDPESTAEDDLQTRIYFPSRSRG